MDSQTKLKRVVIKEELVILTGDHIKALILNQFLYWSERTKDFDKFIREEKERFAPENDNLNMDLTYGWIYKSADELIDELMLNVSAVTIRRHLSKIIKDGYLDQRHNPNHKWDRTWQYRPNIIAIQRDLEVMGYSLDGYPLLKDATFKMKDGSFKMKDRSITDEGAIPETTTETTTEINGSAKNSTLTQNEKDDLNTLAAHIAKATNTTNDEEAKPRLKAATLLGYKIAQACTLIISIIAEADPRAMASLVKVAVSLYQNNVTPEDLEKFKDWWYDNTWQGQKGQPPTPTLIASHWGQFEAQKVINVPSIDTSSGFYV